jgi:hypothetical protein
MLQFRRSLTKSQIRGGHRNLTGIKGIGSLGASILLSVIGNVNDFAQEGNLGAYFGIVSRHQGNSASLVPGCSEPRKDSNDAENIS